MCWWCIHVHVQPPPSPFGQLCRLVKGVGGGVQELLHSLLVVGCVVCMWHVAPTQNTNSDNVINGQANIHVVEYHSFASPRTKLCCGFTFAILQQRLYAKSNNKRKCHSPGIKAETILLLSPAKIWLGKFLDVNKRWK